MELFKIVKNIEFDESILTNASKILNNKSYLLNTETVGNNVIEKFISNIANYHIELNKDLNNLIGSKNDNSGGTFIEFKFCVKDIPEDNNKISANIQRYDNGYDNENNTNVPNISCVTFLNDSNISFITGNINTDEYNFKTTSNKKIDIAIHNRFNHIRYDSNNIYSFCNLSNVFEQSNIYNDKSITLFVHIWSNKPNIPMFSYLDFTYEYYSVHKQKLDHINESTDIIDIDDHSENIYSIENNNDLLIANMLYNDDNMYISTLNKIFKHNMDFNNTNNHVISLKPTNDNKTNVLQSNIYESSPSSSTPETALTFDSGQLIDIESCDKYRQRFLTPDILSPTICDWIITEFNSYAINNNGWQTDRHTDYPTTDILIEKIPCILNLLLNLFDKVIMKNITRMYSLPNGVAANIIDLFIVKYEENKQVGLGPHVDASNFTVTIALNDNFKNGGVQFSDGSTIVQKPGEMLTITKRDKHSVNNITEGCRYVIVFFIDIINAV